MSTVTYQLRNDDRRIAAIQRATTDTEDFGIYPSHGLLGSDEWWAAIESGELETHTYIGLLKRIFISGHGDYPEMVTEDADGITKNWTREADSAAMDAEYKVGRAIEIDYVRQQQRLRGRPGKETEIVLEIRLL